MGEEAQLMRPEERRALLQHVLSAECLPSRLVKNMEFNTVVTGGKDGRWSSLDDILEFAESEEEMRCIKTALIRGLKKLKLWTELMDPEELKYHRERAAKAETASVMSVVSAKTGKQVAGKKQRKSRKTRKARKTRKTK